MEKNLELEPILRKIMRFPWEVCQKNSNFKDKEIADYVTFHAFAGDAFKDPPRDEADREMILHTCANAMVIALTTQRGKPFDDRNRFYELSDDEKQYLFATLAINPLEHESILQFTQKTSTSLRLASYVAAAYAFTTYTKPFVLSFEKLADIAYQAQRDGTVEETALRQAGLFILTDLGAPSRVNETAYSFLLGILNRRSSLHRMNMIFDLPRGLLLKSFHEDAVPTRLEVIDTYLSAFPRSLCMDSHLVGGSVHMPLIDNVEVRSGEHRKAITV